VLAGSANFFFTALVCGAVGGVLSLANCLPGACCELYEACRAGDIDRARRLHFRLFRLNRNVSGRGGVAAVKAAMEMLGYRGGDPRRPLLPLAQADRQEMRRVFEEEGVL
jgi:4-hydroxy-2-oxoglutarate aldolase